MRVKTSQESLPEPLQLKVLHDISYFLLLTSYTNLIFYGYRTTPPNLPLARGGAVGGGVLYV